MSRILFAPEQGQRVPVQLWVRNPSPETLRQLQRIASQPYSEKHVAAMADAHVSEGVAVGTVFATRNILVPEALGGDLGCGMLAQQLTQSSCPLGRPELKALLEAWQKAIPCGTQTHRGAGALVPEALLSQALSTHDLEHKRKALAPRHLGTLGGGNHFLELDCDPQGTLWLLVHSGSRGLGAAIAEHHGKVAQGESQSELGGLAFDSPQGKAFWNDLAWALAFARENRKALALGALSVLADVLGESLEPSEPLDVVHNFASQEHWFGEELLIHRKGAVAVRQGALALIPGSMGTASYLVEGLGNEQSFGSCSHGAGRQLRRAAARKSIAPKALQYQLRSVVWPEHLARDLVEEAPAAYRDIQQVLEDQKDLVQKRLRLEPLVVLKG